MPNQLNPRRAVYTGMFDPVHLGHLDVIARASRILDRLIVGVGVNPAKEAPFFTLEERMDLLRTVTKRYSNVEVAKFEGLAVNFVREMKAGIIIRGLRTLSDMETEFTMSLMNRTLDPDIETVFLMAQEEYSHVSSSLLRQVATLGGDLNKFMPPEVALALQQRARERGSPPKVDD
jgi:pantetheine-phosphate adenylyltransferase